MGEHLSFISVDADDSADMAQHVARVLFYDQSISSADVDVVNEFYDFVLFGKRTDSGKIPALLSTSYLARDLAMQDRQASLDYIISKINPELLDVVTIDALRSLAALEVMMAGQELDEGALRAAAAEGLAYRFISVYVRREYEHHLHVTNEDAPDDFEEGLRDFLVEWVRGSGVGEHVSELLREPESFDLNVRLQALVGRTMLDFEIY